MPKSKFDSLFANAGEGASQKESTGGGSTVPSRFDSLFGTTTAETDEEKAERLRREPKGFFTGALDFLARGQYMTARATNVVADAYKDDGIVGGIASLGEAVGSGLSELINPTHRTSYEDVIKTISPDFAEEHPWMTLTMGLIGDIAFDPSTYLTLGKGGVAKISSKAGTLALTKAGAKKYSKVAKKIMDSKAVGGAEAVERAEKVMARLVTSNTELAVDTGLNVGAKIPFARKQIDTNQFFRMLDKRSGLKAGTTKNKISEITGSKKLREKLSDFADKSTVVETFNAMFRRTADLPHPFIKMADKYVSDVDRADNAIAQITQKIIGEYGLTKGSNERIAKLGHEISDMMAEYAGPVLSPDQKAAWIRNVWKAKGGTDKEFGAYQALRSQYDEILKVDQEFGLGTAEWAEYMPRNYDLVADGDEFVVLYRNLKRRLFGSPDEVMDAIRKERGYGPAKARKYQTLREAIEDGHTPQYDAMLALTNRYMAQKRLIARTELEKGIKQVLHQYRKDPKALRAMDRELIRIGRLEHGTQHDNAALNELANAYDFMLNAFKTTATVLNPAFGVFNVSSNRVQRAMVEGGGLLGITENAGKAYKSIVKTMGFFDPTTRTDAAFFMQHLNNPDMLKNAYMDTAIGIQYSGPELAEMLHKYRIVQGRALLDVGSGASAHKKVERQLRWNTLFEKAGVSGKAATGMREFIRNNLTYWRWPSKVEDFGRTSAFFNALKLGHSPEVARNLTNKALFDYSNGLTKFEQDKVKKLFPFYSFQRFALPMLMETAVKHPGRIATTKKSLEAAMSAYGKFSAYMTGRDSSALTDKERYAIPGWVLEQPSTYAGFDEATKQATFHAFNNFTPLDVLNFVESDEKTGKTSLIRTLQKTILAQFAPMLKAPLEVATNKNFFTDRVIKDAYRQKDRLGKPGTVLDGLDAVIPDPVKKMMGWERGVDPRTGEEMIYINPYLTYMAQTFAPITKRIIRTTDNRLTPMERWMATFGNITTYRINFKDSYKHKVNAEKRRIAEKKQEYKQLKKMGLDEEADEYRRQLKELILEIRDERSAHKGRIR